MSDNITIFEVGARDGLQNESRAITVTDKIFLINKLSDCGFKKIEAASFVSPKWVPQMADSDEVMAGIERRNGIAYTALTPNLKGYDRAMQVGCDEVAVFASASEGFSRHNINCSIAESLVRFQPLLRQADKDNIPVRAYISCIVRCPYDGDVAPVAVSDLVQKLLAMGCYEISLGDTIGAATPPTISALLDEVCKHTPAEKLAGHYHDSDGHALQNISASLDYGVRVFDSAVGGLGGCPYAKSAVGNVATEAVVELLDGQGYVCNIDVENLKKAADFARTLKSPAS